MKDKEKTEDQSIESDDESDNGKPIFDPENQDGYEFTE